MRQTLLIDDIDGTHTDVESVTFSLNNTQYEIDLAPHNFQQLHDALGTFITHGRKVRAPRKRANTARTQKQKTHTENEHEHDTYQPAHSSPSPTSTPLTYRAN